MLLSGRFAASGAETEALAFALARADHLAVTIRPALAAGSWVISDRFANSTRAYQGAAGADPDLLDLLDAIVVGSDRPDLTLILDIPAEIGLARTNDRAGAADRFERDGVELHEAPPPRLSRYCIARAGALCRHRRRERQDGRRQSRSWRGTARLIPSRPAKSWRVLRSSRRNARPTMRSRASGCRARQRHSSVMRRRSRRSSTPTAPAACTTPGSSGGEGDRQGDAGVPPCPLHFRASRPSAPGVTAADDLSVRPDHPSARRVAVGAHGNLLYLQTDWNEKRTATSPNCR